MRHWLARSPTELRRLIGCLCGGDRDNYTYLDKQREAPKACRPGLSGRALSRLIRQDIDRMLPILLRHQVELICPPMRVSAGYMADMARDGWFQVFPSALPRS